jgi:hypothetical protein
MSDDKCEQRIDAALEATMTDLRLLWTAYTAGDRAWRHVTDIQERCQAFNERIPPTEPDDKAEYDEERKDIESDIDILSEDEQLLFHNIQKIEDLGGVEGIFDYGLGFDYVPYDDEHACGDYFRWQLSWGGPSDELQFEATADNRLKTVRYVFKDWFDGAHRVLRGTDRELAADLFDWFVESGTVDHVREEATND